MKRSVAKPKPPSKKSKVDDVEMKNNLRLARAMSFFDHVKGPDSKRVNAYLKEWFSQLDQCTSAHQEKKGMWVRGFGEVVSADELKRNASGGKSLLKKPLHPVICCVLEGLTVDEQKIKTALNSSHRVPYFNPGQADRLNTFWLGLCDPQIPPAVPLDNLPDDLSSTNFVQGSVSPFHPPPDPNLKSELRDEVIEKEAQNPTLVGSYAKFAKMLKNCETLTLGPDTYIEIAEKAASLIVAYDLQNNSNVAWDDEKRKSLLCEHAKSFLKEGAPMTILATWQAPELKSYVKKEDCTAWDGNGIEVRKELTTILETKIASLRKGAKIPAAVKSVAKFYSKRRIKGIKQLLR